MTQLFISGNPALTPDQLTTRNFLDNSKQIVVDGSDAKNDYWKAIPLNISFDVGTHVTVSLNSNIPEDVAIYGSDEWRNEVISDNNNNPKAWTGITVTNGLKRINGSGSASFIINQKLPYNYLVLWSGISGQHIKQIVSNVMVQFGDKATVWTPSLHDMGIPTLDDFNELKSHLGGVKPSYRLCVTSLKEVA